MKACYLRVSDYCRLVSVRTGFFVLKFGLKRVPIGCMRKFLASFSALVLLAVLAPAASATPVSPAALVTPTSPTVPTSPTSPVSPARLAGVDRFETAVSVALAQFASPDTISQHPGRKPAETVYLTTGRRLADALVASRLWDGPVLFVDASHAPRIQQAVAALNPRQVVALGGEGAVSTPLLNQVAGGRPTARLGGADRYHTAAQIAQRLHQLSGEKTLGGVMLARGDAYPDALAGALVPGTKTDPKPILLTTPSLVPQVTVESVGSLGARNITVLGGEAAVSTSALAALTTPVAADSEWQKQLAETRLYLDGWFYDKNSSGLTAPYVPIPSGQRQVGIRPTDGRGNREVAFMGWREAARVYDKLYHEASAGFYELMDELARPSSLRNRQKIWDAAAKLEASDLDNRAAYEQYYRYGAVSLCRAFPRVLTGGDKCEIYDSEYRERIEKDATYLVDKALDRVVDAKRKVEEYEKKLEELNKQQKDGTSRVAVTRLGGVNRYHTGALIARSYLGATPATLLVVVRGDGASEADFADAVLAGGLRPAGSGAGSGGMAALIMAPHDGALPPDSAQLTRDFKRDPTRVVILGGTGAITDTIAAQL